MSSEALSEAKAWLEAIASADPKVVRPSGLAAALLTEVARLEQALTTRTLTADDQSQARRIDELNAMLSASEEHTQLAEAALAVAREREQRAADALRGLMGYARDVDIQAAEIQGGIDFRAALVDEPAAAGTSTTHREASMRLDGDAKPPAGVPADGEEGAVGQQGTGRGPGDAATADDPGQPVAPGSASAAADEPGETPA